MGFSLVFCGKKPQNLIRFEWACPAWIRPVAGSSQRQGIKGQGLWFVRLVAQVMVEAAWFPSFLEALVGFEPTYPG